MRGFDRPIASQPLAVVSLKPRLGRARDKLSVVLLSFTVGSYKVLYLPLPDGVDLPRILHGARDFETLLTAA